jgi:Asp-tRNA(Asn)/Glu-tRNA(Gln) amidotransferase A subunit family amidase
MDKRLFTKMDEAAIDIVNHAVGELQSLGATMVDPGPDGALFQSCINKYAPAALDHLFTKQLPTAFPVDAQGKPSSDHIHSLVDLTLDPTLVPDILSIRDFGPAAAEGEGQYRRELYVRQRGDSSIKTGRDMTTKVNAITDPQFLAVTRPRASGSAQGPAASLELNMADRMLQRFAFQQTLLACMSDLRLNAVVYPTMNVPPLKINQPDEPVVNGRSVFHWTVFGHQGFPTITVPAGFTTEVYDRVLDPTSPDGTRLVGPTPAKLPIGMDFAARPFDEATLVRLASAYTAVTKHRLPPPDFGPLPNEE